MGFRCECESGWGGARCDVPLAPAPSGECAARPCLNGGSCRDTPDGPVCECRPGFAGALCDQPADCRAAGCPPHQVSDSLRASPEPTPTPFFNVPLLPSRNALKAAACGCARRPARSPPAPRPRATTAPAWRSTPASFAASAPPATTVSGSRCTHSYHFISLRLNFI